jgi:hypothetical protein
MGWFPPTPNTPAYFVSTTKKKTRFQTLISNLGADMAPSMIDPINEGGKNCLDNGFLKTFF